MKQTLGLFSRIPYSRSKRKKHMNYTCGYSYSQSKKIKTNRSYSKPKINSYRFLT